MKKIFGILFVSIATICFSFGENIASEISQKYEYVDFGKELISNQSYTTNKGNTYDFWGNLSVFKISGINDADELIGQYGENDIIFTNHDKEIWAFSKKGNLFDISNCKKISINEKILFDAYDDMIKISNPNSIFGEYDGKINCYINGNDVYMAKNSFQDIDMSYIIQNFENIKNKVSKIQMKSIDNDQNSNLLKNLYKYVLDSTSYNYDYLKYNLSSLQNDAFYPWRIQGFFDNKKLVCGGYSLVFSFLSNLYGIKAEIYYGDIQSIDKKRLNLGDKGHNRVKIGNLYFDATFDDSDDKGSYDYFAKSKICFNLDHYASGWVNFENKLQRFEYIEDNFDTLWSTCPQATINTVLADDYIAELVKFVLKYYDLSTNKELLCKTVNLCKINAASKEDLLEYLKLITLKFNSREINLGYSIGTVDFKSSKSVKSYANSIGDIEKILNLDSKIKINKVINSIKTKYKGKDIEFFFERNKSKIQSILNSPRLNSLQKLKINYLNDIFLVENLK